MCSAVHSLTSRTCTTFSIQYPFDRCFLISTSFFVFASFIENYGTHIVTSITIGGRDVVYIRQHQSSPLSMMDIENYVKDIGDERFMDSKSQSSAAPLKYKDKVGFLSIYYFLVKPNPGVSKI